MRESEVRRRAAWRFVRAVVRAQADGVFGAVLAGLLWQTGAVAAPLIVKYAIDHGVVPRDRHVLVLWLLTLLGVGLLEVAAGGMRHIYAIRNRARTDRRVRDAIFAHALRLDAAYHDRVGPGELMSRASSDSEDLTLTLVPPMSIARLFMALPGKVAAAGAALCRGRGRPAPASCRPVRSLAPRATGTEIRVRLL